MVCGRVCRLPSYASKGIYEMINDCVAQQTEYNANTAEVKHKALYIVRYAMKAHRRTELPQGATRERKQRGVKNWPRTTMRL